MWWSELYKDAKEAISKNTPEPQGKEVDICMCVDSDHTGDKVSHRSRSGLLIHLNTTSVEWFSKKQSTVETSVFGAEFVAMKQGIEALQCLRYKLRVMGIPISGSSCIYGDNMSVVHYTSRPKSVLRKTSNSVCYYAVCESVAMGESQAWHIHIKKNIADLWQRFHMDISESTWLALFLTVFMMAISYQH